jgi:hypothetical protein
VPLATIEDLARGGGPASRQAIGTLPDVQTALDTGTLVVPGGGSSGPVAHDYVSDGDTNGIFYALGTNSAESFSQPRARRRPGRGHESGILRRLGAAAARART